ncbi:MAG: hypothetical protein GXO48_08595 [Chlorobi bacterium]|nr:hypothetical protein [Chlorobiota bacterium]
MKKALIVIAVLGTMALVGCKKDWICECDAMGSTIQAEILNSTKKTATAGCKDIESKYQQMDPNATCTLKSK